MKKSIRLSTSKKKIHNFEDLDDILEEPEIILVEDEENTPSSKKDSQNNPSPKNPSNKFIKGRRNIEIRELDINIIPPSIESYLDPDHTGSKIAVIGKPGTGKSTLIKSILYEKRSIFPCAQVYSGTEDSNHAYTKFMPSTFVFNKFDQTAYANFIKRQKIAKQYLKNPWAVVIWDDITEDERIFNLPLVKGTYKNGRHWKMLHVLSLQYALDIKPVIRTNIDGTFILRETSQRNRKVLWENYASCIDTFSDFCSIMDEVTNDYTALYIHNRVQSNRFEDCVFYYKARKDIPDDWQFGCNEIRMFHNERYNEEYVDPIVV